MLVHHYLQELVPSRYCVCVSHQHILEFTWNFVQPFTWIWHAEAQTPRFSHLNGKTQNKHGSIIRIYINIGFSIERRVRRYQVNWMAIKRKRDDWLFAHQTGTTFFIRFIFLFFIFLRFCLFFCWRNADNDTVDAVGVAVKHLNK